MCFFMYMGGPREVFKPEFPYIIERGIPFSADGLFVDLFQNDTLYVLVDPAKAKDMLEQLAKAKGDLAKTLELRDGFVKLMEPEHKAKLAAWYAVREALAAQQPAPPAPEAPREPAPHVRPVKKGGEG